jgi:hypothetical protein
MLWQRTIRPTLTVRLSVCAEVNGPFWRDERLAALGPEIVHKQDEFLM